MNLIRTRSTSATRAFKIELLKGLIEPFHTRTLVWINATVHSWYLHVLHMHVVEQYECCPVDLVDASGSGIEQVNKEVKAALQ